MRIFRRSLIRRLVVATGIILGLDGCAKSVDQSEHIARLVQEYVLQLKNPSVAGLDRFLAPDFTYFVNEAQSWMGKEIIVLRDEHIREIINRPLSEESEYAVRDITVTGKKSAQAELEIRVKWRDSDGSRKTLEVLYYQCGFTNKGSKSDPDWKFERMELTYAKFN